MTGQPLPDPTAQDRREFGTVADSIAATLAGYGVRFAFGIPGNDVLELIRACEEHGIDYVLAKSEPAAAFMADAVWQLTGRPAVLIPAMGPGLANAMAGIGGALMERSALLVLSGDIPTRQAGIYSHQVFDHLALARPLVKHADRLNPARATQQVARALDIATAYPAGPVLLNCPADLASAAATQAPVYTASQTARSHLTEAEAAEIRTMLNNTARPIALIGRGALTDGVSQPLRSFLEGWGLPFFSTYKAKGVVDEHHPLCLGAVGLSPVIDARNLELIAQADFIVMIGFDPIELRDGWLDAWAEGMPCLTIDWAPQTHRVFPVGRQATGDLPAILAQLVPRPSRGCGWSGEALDGLRRDVAAIVHPRQPKSGISPAALFKAVDERLDKSWVLTVDVGAHRILAAHAIRCRAPGQLVQSNGLCCMGYAIPAAIGAALARPEAPVIALVGDGCALMTVGELGVAAERDLPIVVVVLNDAALALIKLKQSKAQMERRAVDFAAPRFDKIAEGFGARGIRVETAEDFAEALDEAVATRRLTVIDAAIDPAEYWEQM